MSLRTFEPDDDDGRCAECERRPAAGPCAACEAMICGDCGVMTKDPESQKVICLSCANMASATRRPRPRRAAGNRAIAIAVLVAFAATTLSLLL